MQGRILAHNKFLSSSNFLSIYSIAVMIKTSDVHPNPSKLKSFLYWEEKRGTWHFSGGWEKSVKVSIKKEKGEFLEKNNSAK